MNSPVAYNYPDILRLPFFHLFVLLTQCHLCNMENQTNHQVLLSDVAEQED